MNNVLLAGVFLIAFAQGALAIDKGDLDMRIRKIAVKFDSMQQRPDKRIPADQLKKAHGIILLDRTKAGFIFAFQGGSGVGMAKDPRTGQWGPPAFYKANEASLGFQIGGQQSFMVILLMNTNSLRMLTEPGVDFGGEASGTAGEDTAREEASLTATEPAAVVYDDRKGLYGGAALKGGAIEPNDEANIVYYGAALAPGEILFDRKVKPSDAARELASKISSYARTESR